MKSILAFFGILAFNFTTSAQASEFLCPVPAAVDSFTCSGTVTVTTLAELEAYRNNLGVVAKKPTIAKNLQIAFNPSFTSDIMIATPCLIKIHASSNMNSTGNICLNSSKGISIGEGFQFTGKNLRLESKEEVIVEKNSTINATDIKLLSIGSGDTSKAYVRDGAHITAANLSIESFDKGFVGKDSNIFLTGTLGLYTLGDEEASIRHGAIVQAKKIEVSSTNVTKIANLAKLTADQIILNGQTCEVNKGAVIASTDRMGNCFLSSLTKAKFNIDKTQGSTPLTINFNASGIADAKGFIWSFGDGETANSLTPTISHIYSRIGSYTATLQYATKDNYKGLKSAGGVQIDVKVPVVVPTTPPRGTFNYAQDGTFIYLKSFIKRTQFDIATAYYVFDDDQANKLYMSNFYQNSQSSIDLHTFGAHKITMYVEDVQGQKYNTTLNIDLKQSEDDIAPVVRFYGEQSAVNTAFINMVYSFIPVQDEFLENFTVEFGDGQSQEIEGATSVVHTYAQAGTYNVKISAEYNGNVRFSTVAVTVTNTNKPAINPVAGFDYHLLDFAGNVTFADDRSGTPNGEIISYEWNFGDGQDLTYGEYASHFFNPGDYLVTLTVTDSAGLRSSQTQKVHIASAGDDLVSSLQCWSDTSKVLSCNIFALDKDNQITRVKVSWGDGTTQVFTEAEISEWGLFFGEHEYQSYGTYRPTLTVNTSRGITKNSTITKIFSSVVANINCSVSNLLVSCNALGSYDPLVSTLEYTFDYGDGYIEKNFNGISSHAFTTSGLHQVNLKVSNLNGSEGFSNIFIQVMQSSNVLPIASLTCFSNSPLNIKCYGDGSYDPDGNIFSYRYEWDDGTSDERGSASEVSHNFGTGGQHIVKLVVSDNMGATGVKLGTYQVMINNAPVAALECSSTVSLEVHCQSFSSDIDAGDSFTQYKWNLGNGYIVSTIMPFIDYKYQAGGTYVISLTVQDSVGAQSVASKSLLVMENQAPLVIINCDKLAGIAVIYKCNSLSSSDVDGTISEVSWNVDGIKIDGDQFTFEFMTSGSKTITAFVKDNEGKLSTKTINLDVTIAENEVSCIEASSMNYECHVNNLTGGSSGDVLNAVFTFDNRDMFTGTEIGYEFASFGNHTVSIKIQYANGTFKDVDFSILVSNRYLEPLPEFVNEVDIGKIVYFNSSLSTATDRKVVKYIWYFGDGTIVETANPEISHNYSHIGWYDVKLKVINEKGEIGEIITPVYVYDPEVKHPGNINDLSIAGIDSDNDGVRDDLQRWINKNSYDSSKAKNAFRSLATLQKNQLQSVDDSVAVLNIENNKNKIKKCIDSEIFDTNGLKKSDEFDIVYFNSNERLINASKLFDIIKNRTDESITNNQEGTDPCANF